MKIDLTSEMADLVSFMGSLMSHVRREANEILGSGGRHVRPAALRILDWSDTTHILGSISGPCRSGDITPDVREFVLLHTRCLRECLVEELVAVDERGEAGGGDWFDSDLSACFESGVQAVRALEVRLKSCGV